MGEAWTTLTRCPQAHSHNSNRQVLSRDGTKDRRRQRFQLRKQTRWSRRSGPLQCKLETLIPLPFASLRDYHVRRGRWRAEEEAMERNGYADLYYTPIAP